MPERVLHTQALRRTFDNVVALEGLDLAVDQGEIFGLVGPDGAGKTTTMRLLSGILSPTAGRAEVLGWDVQRDAEALKSHIGYMSQRFGLYGDLSVLENLHFYADIYGVPRRGRAQKVERLLGFSQLTPFRHRLAAQLSGGMKQKLGLACALIHAPRLLLLDEPTNGVDPVSRRDFWRILYQLLGDGVTIFVSTAYLDEAERCHRLALLHQGRLVGVGTPAEIKRLMPGRLLEVRTSTPRSSAALLRSRLPQAHVSVFGDRLHVVAGTRASLENDIRAALAAGGHDLLGLQPIPPSLEDVFVSVVPPEADRGHETRAS